MKLNEEYNLIDEKTGLPMGHLICSCGTLFKKTNKNQRYCIQCRARESLKKKRDRIEWGICPCGQRFKKRHKGHLHCKAECRRLVFKKKPIRQMKYADYVRIDDEKLKK